MSKITKTIIGLVIAVIVIWGGYYFVKNDITKGGAVRVGIITDLTGPAAYWGESTRVGAELAKKELEDEGYSVEIIYEDYQLDAAKAVSAAQKLVVVDAVDAIYAEFNPAAIAVSSFIKDKDMIFMYDAAVTSPLKDNANTYKTYLDYREGCKKIAQGFKDEGIEKMGILKGKLEFGTLCYDGVKEVYGNDLISEEYNLGDADLKTQVVKLKAANVGAVINVGFEGETMNTLKSIRELGMRVRYGTVDDTVTNKIKEGYAKELTGALTFGFSDVDGGFAQRIVSASGNKKMATDYAAALAYTHTKQIVRAISKCKKDLACTNAEISGAQADTTIGFNAFRDRTADLIMNIKEY